MSAPEPLYKVVGTQAVVFQSYVQARNQKEAIEKVRRANPTARIRVQFVERVERQ